MQEQRASRAGRAQVLVLGPVGLSVAGGWVAAPSAVARAVLAALAVSAGPVTASALYELVWGSRTPRPAPTVVPVAVHRLRDWLRQHSDDAVSISSVSGGYVLSAGRLGTDVQMFRALVAEAAAAHGPPQLSLLRSALSVWRGRPLVDVPPESRDEAVVARLERERTDAIRTYARVALEEGAAEQAVGLLEEATAADPLDESTHALLVQALSVTGRQAAALRVYERVRGQLGADLGVDPGPQLQGAYLQVLRTQRPVADDEARSGDQRKALAPCLLPPDIADFTGRQREVNEVCTLLVPDRRADTSTTLVVSPIAGRGGVGKTALAVHVAHRLRDQFPDGQLFVNLRGAEAHPAEPVEVLARFLRALGVDDTAVPQGLTDRQDMYRNRLAGQQVLVVLDNASDEAQVEPLLPGSPTCGVLVTSRSRLTALAGAHAMNLDVLETDPAVQLVATIAGPRRVAAEPEAATELVRLCGRLPLAVRVVGARLAARRHWTLAQLVDRLSDERRRLDELTYRHLEVRASLALSYKGVDEQSRQLMRWLGLLDAPTIAAWVAAPLLQLTIEEGEEIVERLVDAQLLDVAGRDTAGQVRYRMHDLVRLYARERAHAEESEADRTAALERVFGTWLDLVRRAATAAAGPLETAGGAMRWPLDATVVSRLLADPLMWFDTERLGLIAATRHAAAAKLDELCWELTYAATGLFTMRNRFDEARDCLEIALAAAEQKGNTRGQAIVLLELADLDALQNQFEQAIPPLEHALRLFKRVDDRHGQAMSLLKLAHVDRWLSRYEPALPRYQQALAGLRTVGARAYEAEALRCIGSLYLDLGDIDAAEPYMEQSVAAARAMGHRRWQVLAVQALGDLRLRQGRLGQAEQAFTEELEFGREVGLLVGQAHGLLGLGQIRLRQGLLDAAGTLLQEALAIAQEANHRRFEALALAALGQMHQAQGNPGPAADYVDRAIAICRTLRVPKMLADLLVSRGDIAHTVGQAGTAATAWAEALAIYTRIGSGQARQLTTRLRPEHDVGSPQVAG